MKAGYKVIQIKGKNGAVYLYEDRSYYMCGFLLNR